MQEKKTNSIRLIPSATAPAFGWAAEWPWYASLTTFVLLTLLFLGPDCWDAWGGSLENSRARRRNASSTTP